MYLSLNHQSHKTANKLYVSLDWLWIIELPFPPHTPPLGSSRNESSQERKSNHSRIRRLECRWNATVVDVYRMSLILIKTPDRIINGNHSMFSFTWPGLLLVPAAQKCQLFLMCKLWILLNLWAHVIALEFLGSLEGEGEKAGVLGVRFPGHVKDRAYKWRSVPMRTKTWGVLKATGWRAWPLTSSLSSALFLTLQPSAGHLTPLSLTV